MKTSKILAVAALSLLTIAGAQAETYQGVQTVNSVRSRADVAAVVAACLIQPATIGRFIRFGAGGTLIAEALAAGAPAA